MVCHQTNRLQGDDDWLVPLREETSVRLSQLLRHLQRLLTRVAKLLLFLMHTRLCMMLIIQHNLSLYCQFISLYGIWTMVFTIERNAKGMSTGIPDCKWLGLETRGCHSSLMETLQQVEQVTDDDIHTLPSVTLTSGDKSLNHLFICIPDNKRQLIHGNGNDNLVLSCIKSFGRHLMRRLNLFHQWLEAETRDISRDHFQTRLPQQLKVRHINDTCFVDTLFSSVPSIWGFTCWYLVFSFKRTGLDAVYLMRRRSQSPTTFPQMVTECGAPMGLKSDNAQEFKGKWWMQHLQSMAI